MMAVETVGTLSCAPSIFIVGAAKAGTTSLAAAMAHNDAFFLPSLKEPHFFSNVKRGRFGRPQPPVIRDWMEYLQLYKAARKDQLCMDASASYLWAPQAAANIAKQFGRDLRIIISLRDPVDRAYSNYLNDVREGIESRSFEEAISDEISSGRLLGWPLQSNFVEASLYCEGVERFMSEFGRSKVLVLFYENIVKGKAAALSEISAFCEAGPFAWRDDMFPHLNAYGSPRGAVAKSMLASGYLRMAGRFVLPAKVRNWLHWNLIRADGGKPSMSPATEKMLTEYFAEDVARLTSLLGQTPPWPRYNPSMTAS